jgi:hypothetical protein
MINKGIFGRMNAKILASVYLLLSNMIFIESFTLAAPISGKQLVSDCAELQRYANTRKHTWPGSSDTSFSGFENAKLVYLEERYHERSSDHFDRYECEFGYITSISPLGKKVCYGFLKMRYKVTSKKPGLMWGYAYSDYSFPPPESKYCRYVD